MLRAAQAVALRHCNGRGTVLATEIFHGDAMFDLTASFMDVSK